MLPPLPATSACEVCLANHPTFAARRSDCGAHLVNELIRLVYVTFYVQSA